MEPGHVTCTRCKREVPRFPSTMASVPVAHVNRNGESCVSLRWNKRRRGEMLVAHELNLELLEL